MGVKKDIGKAFEDRLKDFKSSPNEKVWDKIEGTLNAKKRKKKIFFWAKLFGIGMLTISSGVIIYNAYNDQNLKPEKVKPKNISSPSEPNNLIQDTNNIIVNIEGNKNFDNNQAEIKLLNKKDSLNNKSANQNKLKNKINGEILNSKNNKKNKNSSTKYNTINKLKNKQNNTRAINSINQNKTITNDSTSSSKDNRFIKGEKRNEKAKNTSSDQSSDKIALNSKTQLSGSGTNKYLSSDLSKNKKSEKLSIEDTLTMIVDSISTKDSIPVKNILKDSIIPKKNIEKKIVPKEESFWEVTFYVAPTYYNTLSKGSLFGENFENHKKEGGVSLSYRVTFDIKLSKKLNIRTGFGKVNLSHTTINVSTTTNSGTIPNLTEFDGISYDFRALENIYSDQLLEPLSNLNFKQKTGYFEVPAELVYKFPRKKLNWKIIGGGSLLKVTDNAVIVESTNGDFTIGKSNNLSNYSFSANLGGGFDYPLTNKLKINVEPMLKYYIKSFNREVGNFKPYSFSIFIGATYKF